jgi:putative flippase GtrA
MPLTKPPAKRLKLTSAQRSLLLSFIRYLSIGGIVFCVDMGTFQLLLQTGTYRPFATTIAYILGVTVHFILNKFLNFRSFERSTLRQLRTYLIVVVFCWIATLLIVEVGVKWGFTPFGAKLVAIALNIPIGYLCHRYLTFGSGISAAVRQVWRSIHRKPK